jgi:pyruvate dehydrogenase E1 component
MIFPFVKFADGSPELEYMRARRQELGGYLPQRRMKAESLPVPGLDAFTALLEATSEGVRFQPPWRLYACSIS